MKDENDNFREDDEKWWKGPLKWVMALFLLLMLITWLVPYYSVKLNPEPADIPTISEIYSQFLVGVNIGNKTGTDSLKEAAMHVKTNDPILKQVSTKIAVKSCPSSKLCHTKAIYYFVRDNIKYISDPVEKEYISNPIETLKTGGGDCDDGSILLFAMLESVGIDAQIVTIPGHAFVKAYMPDAPAKYQNDGWIYLDWTCRNCEFGKIPYNNVIQLES